MTLPRLPIDEVLPALLESLETGRSAVLRAPTGAGKTTRVPPALLDQAWLRGRVIVLEPRRVAARAAARRIAEERGGRVGGEIGYQVRFDRAAGPETRLLVVTEGVLLRMLQSDPFVEGVGAIVFDEFHERRLDSDLALAMVRRVQREVRDDLRIVVMSATLEAGPVARFLGDCQRVESEGRSYPVEVDYLERPDERRPADVTASGVRDIWARSEGDVLVFLPGVGSIHRAAGLLEPWARQAGADIARLYGDLPAEQQDAALRPGRRRRVILATNVAETSVTIEGVETVVDSGFAHVMRFDPGCGLDRLVRERISRASAEQRAGRAGRTAPGRCLRLWTRGQQAGLSATLTPEIRRVDLTGPLLELLAWGEPDPSAFEWLEPPEPAAVELAWELLERLGAVASGALTPLGRQLARLPAHPRLARVLVESHRLGEPGGGSVMAALLSERDPFRRVREATWVSSSDVVDRLEALDAARSGRPSRIELRARGAARRIERAARQLERETRRCLGRSGRPAKDALRRALLAGYPDRVALRRETTDGPARGVMVGRRGVRLAGQSAVRTAELFVCVDIDAGRRGRRSEALVRQASAVEVDWLPAERIVTETVLRFDEGVERVVADEQRCFEDLVLETRRVSAGRGDAVAAVLEAAARENPQRALPLERADVAGFLARLNSLADWRPDLGLPRLEKAELTELLPGLCAGKRGFDELQRLSLDELVGGALTWQQRQTVERLAPERLTVPTGSHIRLVYEPGRPPILAVRIQELFGLEATPRIAGGRVPVLLHLLAPSYRPQQVTDDLASFWANTYPEVRKELRRRYPKHSWPEDPLAAKPQRK